MMAIRFVLDKVKFTILDTICLVAGHSRTFDWSDKWPRCRVCKRCVYYD